MNKTRKSLALCIGTIGFTSILLNVHQPASQLTARLNNKQLLRQTLQLEQPAAAEAPPALPQTETAVTQAEIIIRQRQVDAAREYENSQRREQEVGVGTRAGVLSASLIRMDYEVELLRHRQ